MVAIRRDVEFTSAECVRKALDSRKFQAVDILVSFSAHASNLNLIDLAQLDDLWLEAMLNERETIENGIVVLLDMSGYVQKLSTNNNKLFMF